MKRLVIVGSALSCLISVVALSACQRVKQSAAIPVVGDTLRGVVQVVGAEPGSVVQLRLASGQVVPLESAELAALRMTASLEVMVRGATARANTAFVVEQFSVRAVDGIPAVDGWLLSTETGRYALRMADGSQLPLAAVPTGMTPLVGGRVFWAGPLDRAPSAYGVLVPPRQSGPPHHPERSFDRAPLRGAPLRMTAALSS
jgi:hypothetical protein